MLKMSGDSILKPLEIMFNNCLSEGTFPADWKKANVIPIHKKNDKQSVKNYRPVSLLAVCGKMFERLLYDSLFEFLNGNNLISPCQSGFKPGDSCINQLLSITHEIYSSFDNGLQVRGVFLDISKAFDKVWHAGLIYKLRRNGISGVLIKILSDFLNYRYQRVVLNGQTSNWSKVKAGVPRGSILGPLLFLVYINDLSVGLISNPKLFADGTSLFSVVHDMGISTQNLNQDLIKINNWAVQWKMSFNPDPIKEAKEIIFSRKLNKTLHPNLVFNLNPVNQSSNQKHLGMILDNKLNFNEHINEKVTKANKGIGIIRKLRPCLPRSSLLTIYKSFIRPHLDYGDVIFDQPYNESFCQKLETIQYIAALAITGAIRGTSKERLYQELGLEYLQSRRWLRRLCLFYKIYKSKFPLYLYNLIPSNRSSITRNSNNIPQLPTRTAFFKNTFFPSVIIEWNKLDFNVRNSVSLEVFKKSIFKFIRPSPNSIFKIDSPEGIKLLTRLRVGISHLRDHKFKHNFQDTLNPLCKLWP